MLDFGADDSSRPKAIMPAPSSSTAATSKIKNDLLDFGDSSEEEEVTGDQIRAMALQMKNNNTQQQNDLFTNREVKQDTFDDLI